MGCHQLDQWDVTLDGLADEPSDERMGLAERHALLDERLGQVDGRSRRSVRGRLHTGFVPGDGLVQPTQRHERV